MRQLPLRLNCSRSPIVTVDCFQRFLSLTPLRAALGAGPDGRERPLVAWCPGEFSGSGAAARLKAKPGGNVRETCPGDHDAIRSCVCGEMGCSAPAFGPTRAFLSSACTTSSSWATGARPGRPGGRGVNRSRRRASAGSREGPAKWLQPAMSRQRRPAAMCQRIGDGRGPPVVCLAS